MTWRRVSLLTVAALLTGPAIYSLTRSDPSKTDAVSKTLLSAPYCLDKIYRSMEGPMSVENALRLGNDKGGVQWITGVDTEVVDAASQNRISQEFFCHSNLTFAENSGTAQQFNRMLGGKTHLDWRLFTLVPGRLSIELPKGFGVPVPANVPLDYVTMSLNLNAKNEVVNVRMRTNLRTVAGDNPGAPTKALFRRALYVLQPHGDFVAMGPACMAKPGSQHSAAGCGEIVKGAAEGLMNHWIVPTGHHLFRTEVTPQLNLPFDTTIHYATIHVHPFARWMELRDLTSGQTVFRLNAENWPNRVGVAHVDEVKSIDGIPIRRDHRYELAADYDNTSGSNTDAMAILYLYLLEKDLT
jgi:hypothetical protein